MKCDYNALMEYASVLRKEFSSLQSEFSSIEECNRYIYNTGNWDSDTRDYYERMYKAMLDNLDAVINKFMNINQYLDTVISNYVALDNGFGGGK